MSGRIRKVAGARQTGGQRQQGCNASCAWAVGHERPRKQSIARQELESWWYVVCRLLSLLPWSGLGEGKEPRRQARCGRWARGAMVDGLRVNIQGTNKSLGAGRGVYKSRSAVQSVGVWALGR